MPDAFTRDSGVSFSELVDSSQRCSSQTDLEKTTEKYGLEAGLWQAFRGKGGKGNQGQQAKDLLTRYGGAYLLTSISFAIVSFAACYALVSAGGHQVSQHREAVAPVFLRSALLYVRFAEDTVDVHCAAADAAAGNHKFVDVCVQMRRVLTHAGFTAVCRRGREVAAGSCRLGLWRHRGEGWHLRHCLCGSQGVVTHPLPSHSGADSCGGKVVWQEAA